MYCGGGGASGRQKNHDLGPPQPPMFQSLLEAMQLDKKSLTPQDQNGTNEFLVTSTGLGCDAASLKVPLLKVQKAWTEKGKPKKMKFKFCAEVKSNMHGWINTCMTQNGRTRKRN